MNKGICTRIRIGEKIKKWKRRKGYLKTSVTLMDVCEELTINRTYLSNFINEKYGMNFNTWVNSMRVKEAQRIMHAYPILPLSIVCGKVGYTDLAHFSKQFKLITGTPPSKWRKENTTIA